MSARTAQPIMYLGGSLTAASSPMETLCTQQTGVSVTDGVSGSVDVARRVATGQEPCDILAGADYKDIDLLLNRRALRITTSCSLKGVAHTRNSRDAAAGNTFLHRTAFRRWP